ncbi:hypothetical protein FQB35_01525 [Crassaminicella thermophila]|uniref:Uncharacterized protein n=1 Tax=Crassaminicella thermophila TaxID=2599308 RepID=A0A5C0SB23_CRATE|nr:hypothetical protein [Crassaminicella thermophila]QEK11147.1 hypothetical protein FQB35_01525 [Crassaminicella thermophila]
MTKREKNMLYIIILLFIVLITKSLFLDEIEVKGDALKFKQFVEKSVDEEKKYNGLLKKWGLVSYKVVDVKKTKKDGFSTILYCGEDGKTCKEIKIAGEYQGKVRGYFLYLFPYKEFKVKSNWKK